MPTYVCKKLSLGEAYLMELERDAFWMRELKRKVDEKTCLSCGKPTHDNEVLCIRCEKINSKNKG